MKKLRGKLTYANVVATLALIIAVAGIPTAVAVTVNASKKSDINKKGKIRPGRVTTTKLANGAVSAAKLGTIQVVEATGNPVATANCPADARLLSGGGNTTAPAALAGSRPEGNGWTVTSDSGASATAYAFCLE